MVEWKISLTEMLTNVLIEKLRLFVEKLRGQIAKINQCDVKRKVDLSRRSLPREKSFIIYQESRTEFIDSHGDEYWIQYFTDKLSARTRNVTLIRHINCHVFIS